MTRVFWLEMYGGYLMSGCCEHIGTSVDHIRIFSDL